MLSAGIAINQKPKEAKPPDMNVASPSPILLGNKLFNIFEIIFYSREIALHLNEDQIDD